MKNRLFTNTFRTIKKSFTRFLSLFIMSMLGVFVFSGLLATSPDMIKTLDNYFDKNDVYDIKIISTFGLTDKDIAYLKDIPSILDVEGCYSKDVFVKEKEFVINVSSLPKNLNKIELIEGRYPSNDNEIVVEPNLLIKNNLSIGDSIYLDDEVFLKKEMIIVGTITSPLYFNSVDLNQNRGLTTLGSGTISYYTYVLDSSFSQDYYSSIYVTVENAKEEITSTKRYEKLVDRVYEKLDSIKEEREEARYQEIYKKAYDKVVKEEKKAQEELSKAKNKLASSKKELDKAKKTLDSSKKKLNTAKKKLDNAKKEIDKGTKQYQQILKETKIEEKKIPSMIQELTLTIQELERELEEIRNQESVEENPLELELERKIIELKGNLTLLKELENTKVKLNNASKEYQKNNSIYKTQVKKYQNGLKEYQTNKKKYDEGLEEYLKNKKEVEEEIKEAYEKLKEIKHPTWYIYDRNDFNTYSEYVEDSNSIRNLSTLFPFIFFAVAILVSLISMNRMVEDDRLEIGTLKSLGFSNRSILLKYFIFAFLATFFGGIFGSVLGLIIIPTMIFNIYSILFDLPNLHLGINLTTTVLGFILSAFCICGTTILTVRKVLKENPAGLMRAKAPKKGKRVILENIKFIWNHLSFSNKVTVRNLFRYKKRVLVTIFGIAGCTALMLCGFGIKDSIVDIASMQYEHTYKFDAMIYVNDFSNSEVLKQEQIENYYETEVISAEIKDTDMNIFVTEDNDTLKHITRLLDKDSNELSLETGKVIMTDKLADLLKVKVGDEITIIDVEHHTFTYQVSAITKNYLGHYVYMDKETYEQSGLEYKTNVIYANTKDLNPEEKDNLSTTLLKDDSILQVVYVETLIDNVTDMLRSLDKVVAILIVLAAILSFVVLYNLSNINIHERKREIATLKVLGFYHHEVDSYITRENIILTIFGITIGLVLGTFLTNTVITTVEIERARFIHHISFTSYFYSSLLSILFTILVNFITHFSLKKIDMIESLKSVE